MMKPRKVLVVEDDPIVALDLSEEIRALGCTVLGPFSDAERALLQLSEDLPDLAIVDYYLSDGTAEQLSLRLQNANVPYIIVSTAREGSVPRTLMPAARLHKPFKIAAIQDFIGGAQSALTESTASLGQTSPLSR